ncbi:MAG: hypothetical protein ACI4SD_00740 [Suilimivivens sp.]
MKKMIKRESVFIWCMVLLLALAGCGTKAEENKNTSENQNTIPKVEVADSAEVLNKIWDTYGEEEKFFVMGGDFNNPVENAAGIFSMEDTENLSYALYIPADSVEMIDEAASLIHAMNSNTFTGTAFHLKNAENAEVLAEALRENIANTQWLCGFPDKMAIYAVNGGEYVISAFGKNEAMDNFMSKLLNVYGESASLIVEEKIV